MTVSAMQNVFNEMNLAGPPHLSIVLRLWPEFHRPVD